MHHHERRSVERHCDVCVVGGSAAGLAAALQLVRQRRSVIVVDAGEPRNAPAAHMHSYLGADGNPPEALLTAGRQEVRSYGGELLRTQVRAVRRADGGGFWAELGTGDAIVARRVLAATGMVDELPDIAGLAAHWGRDVIHCPFCHGYEVRDRRIVQLVTHPMGLHPSPLFRQLTAQLTIVLPGEVDVDEADLAPLQASGVTIVRRQVRRILEQADGRVRGVEFADGSSVDADVVAIGPRFRVRAEPFATLGLQPAPHPSGLGDVVETDGTGETAIPGLFAAGNLTDPSQQVLQAAANGSRVGAMIAFSLAREDVDAAARPSGNAADWDARYSGEQIWSGNPNGSLVNEVDGLPPGRALDVGAGEGGDAIWLAERGWTVTASDVSQRGLDRVTAAATQRGLEVECLLADANGLDPYEPGAFDLVSAQYASIPRTPDDRAVRNLLGAVAPGGTLLVVSHDLSHLHAAVADHGHAPAYDPDAYVRVEDFAAAVAQADGWAVEVHETRTRPPGSATADIHVEDIVLRARRSPVPR
jgi:thioredoxin reductase/SAM-dependent methyltransferase